jgi:hypothetical protein
MVFVMLLVTAWGCGRSTAPAPGTRDAPVLRVLKGTATITRGGKPTPVEASGSHAVEQGDEVATGPDSEAVVIAGARIHHLGASSSISFGTAPGADPGEVGVLRGIGTFLIPTSKPPPPRFRATANRVRATVQGTIYSMAHVEGGVDVTVLRGSVEVAVDGAAAPAKVAAGERAEMRGDAIKTVALQAAVRSELEGQVQALRLVLGVSIETF